MRSTSDLPAEQVAGYVAALEDLAAADGLAAVAEAAVEHAQRLAGARAAAIGLVAGTRLRLLATVGYDCDSFAAGVELPLDAGLPVTEAARSGGSVRAGSWYAVPLSTVAGHGALLVSLPAGAAVDDATSAVLTALARASGRALARARQPTAVVPVPAHPAAVHRSTPA